MPIIAGQEKQDESVKFFCQFINEKGRKYTRYYYHVLDDDSFHKAYRKAHKQKIAILMKEKEDAKCGFTIE